MRVRGTFSTQPRNAVVERSEVGWGGAREMVKDELPKKTSLPPRRVARRAAAVKQVQVSVASGVATIPSVAVALLVIRPGMMELT